jgi:Lrp/AsnC family leucine-responsive transcriptional regulator
MKFDAVDLKLLNLLQRDGKQTTKWLAQQCGLSSTAVFERVKRLENSGIINRYVALLDNNKIGKSLRVFCQVALNQHVKTNVIQFENEVSQLPEVVSCYHIGGAYDYMLEILVRDMQEYRNFLVGKLTAINSIGSTQSSFVIAEVKQTTEIPLD